MEIYQETLKSLRRFTSYTFVSWNICDESGYKKPWVIVNVLGIIEGDGATKQEVIDLVTEKIRTRLLKECGVA